MKTLNDILHHALTDIKRCRKQAEKTQPPRIAAHLDALIAQIEAIIEDLHDPPTVKRIELVDTRHAGESDSQGP